jgi:phasin family protein
MGAQPDMTAAGRRAVRGAAQAGHAAIDAAEAATRSGMEAAARGQRNGGPFMEAFAFAGPAQDMARQSSRNLEAMAQCGTVLAQGLQDITRAWLSITQDGVQRTLDGFNALARARSVQEFVTLQSDLVRDNFETMVNGSRRVAELSAQVAEEATQTVTRQVEHATARHDRAG